ncbi:MAG: hypothetical protein ACETWE_13700 [Candidatus Bathyarchaeia archaeon]
MKLDVKNLKIWVLNMEITNLLKEILSQYDAMNVDLNLSPNRNILVLKR